jgi:hypothetical protein
MFRICDLQSLHKTDVDPGLAYQARSRRKMLLKNRDAHATRV